MESKIHFIRHGITEGITKGWFYGGLDIPLVQEGIDDIKKLVVSGIYPSCEDAVIYTSGMLRANQTLENIYGNLSFEVIKDFEEFKFGRLEGKTFHELKDDEDFKRFTGSGDNEYIIPGGESKLMFAERVDAGWKKLIGLHQLKELSHRHSGLPATSIVVCHGGVIGYILWMLFEEDKETRTMYDWIPDPAHGFTISVKDGKAVDFIEF